MGLLGVRFRSGSALATSLLAHERVILGSLVNIHLLYCAKFALLSSSVLSRVYDYTPDYVIVRYQRQLAIGRRASRWIPPRRWRWALVQRWTPRVTTYAFFPACDQTLPFSDPDHATLRAKDADHAFTAFHESLLGLA
jgi:hypothetical protein